MKKPIIKSELHRQIKERHDDRRDRIQNDLQKYGGEVLDSEEMKEAFQQTHHKWSTVGEHTVRVAATSVLICYVLRKMKINVNLPAVVVGSLCHDLGILGRNEKYASAKECSREHPRESLEVAREIVDEMPEKAEDIIERHMWPLGKSEAPNSLEGVIVSVADKYNAVKDIVKGSEINNTGVKNYLKAEKQKIKDRMG
ncbi:MAG: HD domain-containing protein [Eubacterium sp.]|nr:HD domain-containing protein [Eubacterium sp.]